MNNNIYSQFRVSLCFSSLLYHNQIDIADNVYETSFPYTRHTLKDPTLHHIANEKSIFNLYTHYHSNVYLRSVPCWSMLSSFSIHLVLSSFFNSRKDDLFVPCNDNRLFSFCQEAYIFRYNSSSKSCDKYYRMPCNNYTCSILLDINHGFNGVSLMTQLTYIHYTIT